MSEDHRTTGIQLMTTSASPTLGELLPDYEVGREIGRGAMGIVHLGRHRHLDRDVAIKELPPSLIHDAEVRARFISEARMLANLDHPNIVPVYDFVDRGGRCLLVMEALPGGTLWDRFTHEGMTMQVSVAVAIATADGVDHAHQNGVLHRDIKPENLLFDSNRRLKVTDFGIAKVISGERTMGTVDGSVLGTPAYMAPEQAEGDTLGPEADVYAIGSVLFELVSGRLPFEGDSPMTLLVQRIMHDAPDVRSLAPDVPGPIAEVIARALARDPKVRIGTAAELAAQMAEAAFQAWGPDWLTAVEAELGETARSTIDRSRAPSPSVSNDAERARSPEPAAKTVAPQRQSPSKTIAPMHPQPETATVHPQRSAAPATPAASFERSDLVSLATLLKSPPRRWPLNLAVAMSGLLAILLGLLGPQEPDPANAMASIDVSLNGATLDPGTVTDIAIDEPLLLTGLDPETTGVLIDYSGITVWSSGAPFGETATEIDLGPLGLVLSGPLSIVIESAAGPGTAVDTEATYLIGSDRPWYTSAQGPALIAVLAIAISMAEFRLRTFRNGEVRVFMLIGTALTTAVLAIAATALYAQYSSQTIELADVIPVAAVAALAGALTGLARANHARARRRRATGVRLQGFATT